jgi:hypothetical protein
MPFARTATVELPPNRCFEEGLVRLRILSISNCLLGSEIFE